MLDLKEISKTIHKLAWEKGWHSENEGEDAFIERMCNNLHDEISELHDAWRNNKLHEQCDKPIPLTCLEEELADIAIRLFDNALKLNVNLEKVIMVKHEYNETRTYRHGNKRS